MPCMPQWQKCSGFFVLLVMVMVKPVQLSVERPLSVSAVRRFVELLMLLGIETYSPQWRQPLMPSCCIPKQCTLWRCALQLIG